MPLWRPRNGLPLAAQSSGTGGGVGRGSAWPRADAGTPATRGSLRIRSSALDVVGSLPLLRAPAEDAVGASTALWGHGRLPLCAIASAELGAAGARVLPGSYALAEALAPDIARAVEAAALVPAGAKRRVLPNLPRHSVADVLRPRGGQPRDEAEGSDDERHDERPPEVWRVLLSIELPGHPLSCITTHAVPPRATAIAMAAR
mmetsp:Transcript_113020/g.343932  ORF Transcript_113020/g.343932 Transcript_113020/m.343932 type:complete len:203 (+) Transcript_113020:221-829(+)